MNEILALKIALVVDVVGVLTFIIDYTRLTKGKAWRNPVGFSMLLEALFVLGTGAPLILAAFLHFSALANAVGTWTIIGFFCLTGLSMLWRTVVFERIDRLRRKKDRPDVG
jgi:hypothetical protein